MHLKNLKFDLTTSGFNDQNPFKVVKSGSHCMRKFSFVYYVDST